MLPGMYHDKPGEDGYLNYHQPAEQSNDEKQLVADVISDFTKYPPQVVLVAEAKYHSPQIGNYGFDFIKYFSQEPIFRTIWGNYEKINKVGNISVYLRKNDKPKPIDAASK
jgi:hypothetical protein